VLLEGCRSFADLRLLFFDCFKYRLRLLRFVIVLYIFKYGERLAGDPETILVLVRCHCDLAAHRRHELLREFQRVAIYEQTPLPIHHQMRLLLHVRPLQLALFVYSRSALRLAERVLLLRL